MRLAQMTGPKREFIEYVQIVDECDESQSRGRLTDSEILQQTAYVYLTKGQIFEYFGTSFTYYEGGLFSRSL